VNSASSKHKCPSASHPISCTGTSGDLGLRHLAGFAEPQRAWRVAGESGLLSRFEALRAASLTPLVGREEEIELLLRRWRRAASGEGQGVL
jgi:hypothetical protein